MARSLLSDTETMAGKDWVERASRTSGLALLVMLLLTSWSSTVLAAPTAAERKQADRHFERALELVYESAFEQALVEFRKAYELAPHYAVLYNLAQTHVALGRPVEAVDAFRRYLADGGSAIDRARRVEVEAEIKRQEARIGTLSLIVDPAGSTIQVDGQSVGTAPLQPIRLGIGTHRVVVSAPGHVSFEQAVTLAGEERRTLRTTLARASAPVPTAFGQLTVTCRVPDVDVIVDGRAAGKTPLREPLLVPAGLRAVTFERPGYRTAEASPLVRAGGIERVDCGARPLSPLLAGVAGRLAVNVSEPEAKVALDGEAFDGGVAVPVGRHRIEVTRPGFRPYYGDVNVAAGRTTILPVNLVPTREYADERGSNARTLRYVSYGLAAAGAIAGGVGIYLYVDNGSRYDQWRAEQEALDGDWARLSGGPQASGLEARQAKNDELIESVLARDNVAIGFGIGGAALLSVGAVLYFTGDDPGRYEGPAAHALPGGASVGWRGAW